MGGSAKGKHKKGKGNSMSVSDDAYRPGTSNSDPHVGKIKNENMSEFKAPTDKNQHSNIDLSLDFSGWEKNTKRSLEILLYNKLEGIYAEAFHKLVTSGYESDKARRAILMDGHWRGEKSILMNIIENSITFLESNAEAVKDPLQGCALLSERVGCLMRILIKDMQKIYPDESDALKQLVGIDLGVGAGSSTHPQHVQTENCNNKDGSSADDSSGDNSYIDPTSNFVPEEDFGTAVTKDLLSPEELEVTPTNAWPSDCPLTSIDPDDLDDSFLLKLLEKEPEDQKDLLILSILKQYRELKRQVKESKEWALAKAKQADQKVINHVSELRRLRLENFENQKWKTHITRVREMDIALWNSMSQLEQSTAVVRQLQHQNSVIGEDIARHCLDFSETNKTLRDVEKRERKILKRVRTKEREKIVLEELVEEEKQKMLQLKQEWFQLNKAREEAEAKLAEQLKKKEVTIAVVAEEERLRNIAESNWRSKRASLHLKAQTNRQLLEDDLCMLKDELANLQICQNESFEMSPPESSISHGSSEESQCGRKCIICSNKAASVLFLPCAHQVVCLRCNEEESVRAACPCCQVQIGARVAVYGAN